RLGDGGRRPVGRPLGRRGKVDGEGAALADGAVDLDRAAVATDDVLDDGEAEAGSPEVARARGVDAVEALRQARQVFPRDALAFVLDRDRDGIAGKAPRRRDGPLLAGPVDPRGRRSRRDELSGDPHRPAVAAVLPGGVDYALKPLRQLVGVTDDWGKAPRAGR